MRQAEHDECDRSITGELEAVLSDRNDLLTDEELNRRVRELLVPVNGQAQPNHISALWHVLRDMEAIKLNIKFFGYELLRRAAEALPVRDNLAPQFIGLKSKATTQSDIESDWLAYWASALHIPVLYSRKLWEHAYVLQALFEKELIQAGKSGVGFGCGTEPLPSLLASKGVKTLVTDMFPDDQRAAGWSQTNEYAASLQQAYHPHLVSEGDFRANVTFRHVDMTQIPSDLSGFDFCWSICALEHLGTISKGLDFIEQSLSTIRTGGLAVHTTEFNFLHDDYTIDNWGVVYPQKRHFEQIADRLRSKGHRVAELDFDIGSGPIDKFIDIPPWGHEHPGIKDSTWTANNFHLKVSADGIPTTCFGLLVEKG